MGVLPKWDPPKFKLFTPLSWTHKIFKVSKYKGKIKLAKIWEYRNGETPLNKAAKIQNF